MDGLKSAEKQVTRLKQELIGCVKAFHSVGDYVFSLLFGGLKWKLSAEAVQASCAEKKITQKYMSVLPLAGLASNVLCETFLSFNLI